jgi:hypothetical protein
MHGGYVPDGASRRASSTVEGAPPDCLNKSSRGRLPLFTNCLEEVFSETASEFLCGGVSRCLLLRCTTGAKGHLAPVLLDKDSQS